MIIKFTWKVNLLVFSSVLFLFLFLPLVTFLYYTVLRNKRHAQNLFLFVMSLLFYAAGEPVFVLVMLLSIFANWYFALQVEKQRDGGGACRKLLVLMTAFNLGLIFVFKYLAFAIANLNLCFGMRFPVPEILLPIGISFFTFQSISYVVDVYRQKGHAQKNPFYVGLYIAFFPQLIAGPIVRYETVAEQIQNRRESIEDFSEGVCRFLIGLAKKVLIANPLANVADGAFQQGDDFSVALAWMGAIAFTFQIYYDFSGYSDMAIGLGRMFGFHFLENFRDPYISRSVSEFWRRWHISLGSWFKDYVYFPLGGSWVAKGRLVGNLFVVWLLTGIWHGANWTFIVWGLLYFVLITAEKFTNFEKSEIPVIFKHGYTMLMVTIGWVIFKADSLADATSYLACMFGLSGAMLLNDVARLYYNEYRFFYLFAALFSMPVIAYLSEKFPLRRVGAYIYSVAMIALMFVSISYVIKGSYNPFIYFNF